MVKQSKSKQPNKQVKSLVSKQSSRYVGDLLDGLIQKELASVTKNPKTVSAIYFYICDHSFF